MPDSNPTRDAALVVVRAWNDRYKRATLPVLFDNGSAKVPLMVWGLAYVEPKKWPEPTAAISASTLSGSGGSLVLPLDKVQIHPRAGELAERNKVQGEEASIRYPDCPECYSELTSDGDGFYCESCPIRWSYNGEFLERSCVEDCGSDAVVTGTDGQPRCQACEFAVIIGELEPTGPYECHRCHERVVGMVVNGQADAAGLCGMCLSNKRQAEYMDRLLSRKATVSTPPL